MTSIPARAAVFRERGSPLSIEDVQVLEPQSHEVRVRLVSSGICHTDLLMIDGRVPAPMPAVFGHEGSGVIDAVGSGVTTHKIGDHVVLSFAHCGHCSSCNAGAPSYCEEFFLRNFGCSRHDGSSAFGGEHSPHSHFFGQSSFSSVAVCNAQSAIKVSSDAPLDLLGPLGCGVQTGAGAIVNALQVRPGSTVGVFGAGAVGLSAVMAARIVGASKIVAVDLNPNRLALALELGATHVIDANLLDVSSEITRLAQGGLNYAVDTTGIPSVINAGISALSIRGVMGLIAGVPGLDAVLPIGHLLAGGREIRGIAEGDSTPANFIPILVEWHKLGIFPLERLVRFYRLDEINEAIADTAGGRVIKPIIRF